MKRILEVLQDGDGQLKFRTDINVWKEPMASMDIIQNPDFVTFQRSK